MPSAFERQVLLFHVQPTSIPRGAPILKMKDLVGMIHAEWKAGKAITRLEELEAEDLDQEVIQTARKRPNNAVYIQDMWVGDDHCEILLTLGDAAEADPTIVNLKNREQISVRKGADGGVGFSTHVCISFKGSAPPVQYRATLERMSNLGRNTVLTYLNRVLRNHTRGKGEFRFVEAGTDRDLAYRPKLLSAAQPSRRLLTAFKTGQFSEVVLIQRKKVSDELDQNSAFRVTEKRLKLDVGEVPSGDAGRHKWLNDLKALAKKQNYDEVQVRVKPFGGGNNMSARFSTEVADAADAVFSRHEEIEFNVETGQCHKKLVDRIRDPLAAMLKREALWK